MIYLPHIFQDVKCRTSMFSNSFYPNATWLWNNVVSTTFGVHDPIYLRYIFQLRTCLSNLRSHKKRHNFADTPSDKCLCNLGIEDSNHFFMTCPFYTTHRQMLVTTVREILVKNNLDNSLINVNLYLYGHPSLNNSDNQNVLYETMNYIKKTNRFTT